MARIYLSPPDLNGQEIELLRDAIESNWVAPLGPHVDGFEAEMCSRLGVPHAVALSSGTAALHLGLEVLGIGRGDEVWVSTLTFAATANAVTYVGATPVFVDSSETTWNMDPDRLGDALSDAARRGARPRAVIFVDLYGHCGGIERVAEICRAHGVYLIEDAAESLGSRTADRAAGSYGDLAVLSFNGNKIITTSGGGMLLSHRRDLIERARYLSTQARSPARHYEHEAIGYNYRLSNLLAAVGRAQLRDLDRRVDARRRNHDAYREALGQLPGIRFLREPEGHHSNYWLTTVTLDPALAPSRDAILDTLDARGIEARPVWKPMHLQPIFVDYRTIGGDVSARIFEHGLCLPSGSSLSDTERDMIITIIRNLWSR